MPKQPMYLCILKLTISCEDVFQKIEIRLKFYRYNKVFIH